MEPQHLDLLIERYAQTAVPPLPGSFPSDVLREIRLRKIRAAEPRGWLLEITLVFSHPGMLATCFALALTVGIALPANLRSVDHSAASDSLGLHVFTSTTMNLPSGLLAKTR